MKNALCLVIFLPGWLVAIGSTGFAERPNVIAIVTDDQGQWACGAYGNPEIQTPNMDRLAREGLLFRNAMTCTPVCSPSRASYFSGKWPSELGITDWISGDEAQEGVGLKPFIWPMLFQQAGYRTALIGKWHLGEQPQFHPTQKGFDEFFGFLGGGNRPMNPTLEVKGETQALKGPLPDLLVDSAMEFVSQSREEPFLLCLHFRAPHLPYLPVPEEDRAPFADLDPTIPDVAGSDAQQLKKWQKDYYASIHSVDRNIGRLLRHLDELDLTKNTLVLFTSDHGYNNGRHGVDTKGNGQWIAGGVRGPKRPNLWDTSLKVPMIVRWPGKTPAGTTTDFVFTNLDLFRTMASVANLTVPEEAHIRGEDCSAVFRGEPGPARDTVFGMYDLHNGGLAYLRMIRTERYKYVRHFRARMMDELYDLRADPEETRNLLNRQGQTRVQELPSLKSQLHDWQLSIGDPLLKD